MSMAAPPPPPRHSSMRDTAGNKRTSPIDLDIKFRDLFHPPSQFPGPGIYRGVPKFYNTKTGMYSLRFLVPPHAILFLRFTRVLSRFCLSYRVHLLRGPHLCMQLYLPTIGVCACLSIFCKSQFSRLVALVIFYFNNEKTGEWTSSFKSIT